MTNRLDRRTFLRMSGLTAAAAACGAPDGDGRQIYLLDISSHQQG